MKPDSVDEKIIELLRKDSRTSNVSIAKALGLTEGAVRWRVKRMLENGLIRRFTIDVGTRATKSAVMMVKAKNETKKMMAAISELDIHKDAYEISGEFDGCVILEGSSVEHIDEKVDQIRKLKEVADTRTFISFRHY